LLWWFARYRRGLDGARLQPGRVAGLVVAAVGLMIAFYCGITGFACPIYYRRELFKSTRNTIMSGWPRCSARRWSSASASSCSGVVLMFRQQRAQPELFRRKPEVVGPTIAPDEQAGASDGR
jgi:hypothetical protein